MGISVSQVQVLSSLNFINGVIPSNPISPVLGNVKIFCADGSIVLEATNGDMTAISKISDKSYNFDWLTTISASMLLEFTRRSKSSDISFDFSKNLDSESLKLTSGSFNATIQTMSADSFPKTQDFNGEDDVRLSISSENFIKLIDKTKISISSNDARPQLNGLFLRTKVEDDVTYFYAVSTDGHRLSLARCKIDANVKLDGVLIPRKAILEIRKMIDKKNTSVDIIISASKIKVSVGNFVFISKLLEYEFPAYEKVIPTQNDKLLELNTKDFKDAIDSAVFVYVGGKETAIRLVIKADVVELYAKHSTNVGNNHVSCVFMHNETLETSYNYSYLLDCLNSIDTPKVKFLFNDKGAPCLIRPMDTQDYFFVVMPIRV